MNGRCLHFARKVAAHRVIEQLAIFGFPLDCGSFLLSGKLLQPLTVFCSQNNDEPNSEELVPTMPLMFVVLHLHHPKLVVLPNPRTDRYPWFHQPTLYFAGLYVYVHNIPSAGSQTLYARYQQRTIHSTLRRFFLSHLAGLQ